MARRAMSVTSGKGSSGTPPPRPGIKPWTHSCLGRLGKQEEEVLVLLDGAEEEDKVVKNKQQSKKPSFSVVLKQRERKEKVVGLLL